MKPILEKISTNKETSFTYKRFVGSKYPFVWHFHEEYELTFILKSKGKRFVGDNISEYQLGDLVLIGPNLPHTWFTDPSEHQPKSGATESIVFQFLDNFMGEQIWEKPEFYKIKALLQRSNRGIFFPKSVFKKYENQVKKMAEQESLILLMQFLEILNGLADEKEFEYLASELYSPQINETHQNRIDVVFQYTHDNFLVSNINQKMLAEKIFMSESAFSHFFKKATGKNFTFYLNELRIGYACKKLIETDDTIVAICYQSGFQNLSNFNKRFLVHKKCTPKQFRQNFKNDLAPRP